MRARASGAAIAALLAGALALGACQKQSEAGGNTAATAGPAVPAPPGGWVERVVETPDGGFRMGNPDARAKLVEYASYTCPHCAEFDAEAMPDIRRYVATGRLSYELRSFVRDPYDLMAALLARCGGPGPFFALGDQIFAAQQEWIGNAQNVTPADQRKIQSLPPERQIAALARAVGLNAFAGQSGIPAAKVDRCLGDRQAQEKLVAMRDAAVRRYQVEGTPTFLLNGAVIGSLSWRELKPKLVAAIG